MIRCKAHSKEITTREYGGDRGNRGVDFTDMLGKVGSISRGDLKEMSVDRDKGIGEDCGRLVEFIHHLEIAYRNFGGCRINGTMCYWRTDYG